MAAEAGHVAACHAMGVLAWRGRAEHKDADVEAARWLQRAAVHGVQDARSMLLRICDVARPAPPGNPPAGQGAALLAFAARWAAESWRNREEQWWREEPDVSAALTQAGLDTSGQSTLYDGRTGEAFDRKVTVGMILAILIQTGGIVWSAAQITKDVEDSKLRISKLENNGEKSTILSERVVRVETLVEGVKSTVDRIERRMERR